MSTGWGPKDYLQVLSGSPLRYALGFQPIFILAALLATGCFSSGVIRDRPGVIRDRPSTIWITRGDYVYRVPRRDVQRYVCQSPYHLHIDSVNGGSYYLRCEGS